MLDHLVVSKMTVKGDTLFKEGELDDILRFGAQQLFDDQSEDSERIIYDDLAIDRLLDRSQESIEEKSNEQNEYFQLFKVASFVTNNQESGSTGVGTQSEQSSTEFWERILKSKWEAYEQEEAAVKSINSSSLGILLIEFHKMR